MQENITATLARLESQVDWWSDQAQQVDRDRANLRYVLPIGLLISAIGFYVKLQIGGGLAALAVVIWGMGMYMTTVRRSEFAENLREAQAELDEVQASVRAQRIDAPL